MKDLSVILRSALFIAVSMLFAMCKNDKSQQGATTASASVSTTAPTGGARIAYVDIDTLEDHYDLLKSKKEEFKRRQETMESELQRSYQQMQNDAAEVQKKAQANNLTQPEYEAAQKRLMQMQQSLETRKQALTEQLMKDQEVFNKNLKSRLDSFLAEYNKDGRYDFILSYSGSGSGAILYANKQLNITRDVIKGMNSIPKDNMQKK